MKTSKFLLITAIVLTLSFSSSCGEDPKDLSDKSTADVQSEITSDGKNALNPFERFGLSGIVPPQYLTCTQVAETDESATVLLSEYEFTVKISSDPDLERQFYYNELLSYLKQTVKNGNVYKLSYNAAFDVNEFTPYPPFEDRIDESVKIECHFYLENSERLYKLTVSDTETDSVHIYSLSLTYSEF